jgi:hypothetical protein
VFENRELRGILGPKREAGEDCIIRSFTSCTLNRVSLGSLYEGG